MAEVTRITSEALQSRVRELLPSQVGFGEDLQASNVILPIIDLTTSAEGTTLGTSLQQAINFGGATAFAVSNTTTTIANVGGFYRVVGNSSARQASGADVTNEIIMNDGASDKIVWKMTVDALSSTLGYTTNVDFVFFLRPTDELKIKSSATSSFFNGSVRQIATSTGTLVNPTGFSAE